VCDRGKQHRRTDRQGGDAVGREQLRRNMALVVEHDHVGVVAGALDQRVGADRAFDVEVLSFCILDRGDDEAFFFVTEQPALARVRVDAAHRDLRLFDAEPF